MSSHSHLTRERFRFQSQALLDENALRVVRFTGTEGLSTLYRFEIVLATQHVALPLERMLAEPARLVILREDGRYATFSGLPTHIQQTTRYNDWTFYKLTLQPAFWKFTQIVQNSFHIDRTVREIIDSSLDSIDYFDVSREFRLLGKYEKQEFSMQHNESIYDFLAWKMERDGIYYFFDEQDTGEHLVFADAPLAHAPLETTPELYYSPTSGLEATHRDEVISTFSLNISPLPAHVVLRDYDSNRPNAPVVASAAVAPHGLGTVYCYGEGFTTEAEGKRLAKIRAQALACRGRVFSGEGSVPTLRPGRNFTLKDHYDESCNRDYMLVSVTHEGSQEAWLSQAVGVPIERENDRLFYRNSFTCIPADVQFRPERKTERAKVSGMMSAFVDASTTSGKPEIDAQGRYKVVFPQDDSGRGRGKASCWLRRMQPHVGKGHGTVFPLAPGVEVMVAFVDGNPDRPFIAGAVANGEVGTMEHPGTNALTGLLNDGGNGLVFHNKGTQKGVTLTAGAGSGMAMGSSGLETAAIWTDFATSFFTGAGNTISGISSGFTSGLESSLEANLSIVTTILNQVTPVLTTLFGMSESLCNIYAKGFPYHGGDRATAEGFAQAFDMANNISKQLPGVLKNFKTLFDMGMGKKYQYGVEISADMGGSVSAVRVRNRPTWKVVSAIMATGMISWAPRTVALLTDIATEWEKFADDEIRIQKNKEEKRRAAFARIQLDKELGSTPSTEKMLTFVKNNLGQEGIADVLDGYDKNMIKALIKVKMPQEVKDQIVKEADSKKKEGDPPVDRDAAIDAAIETNYTKYCIEYVPFIRNTLIDKALEACAKKATDTDLKGNKENIENQIRDDAETSGDTSYFESSHATAKAMATINKLGTELAPMVAEMLSYITLWVKCGKTKKDDFGGVHIKSADKNVLISSKTESRMVSDGDIVLRAAGGELANSVKKSHNDLAGQITNLKFGLGNETHLLMTADHTYSGSFKNAKILAGQNMTLGAKDKILLTTEKNDLSTLEDDAILAGVAWQLPEDGDTKYGDISLEPTKIKITSSGSSKKKSTVDIKPDEVAITVEGEDDKSSLSIEKNKIGAKAKDMQLTLNGDNGSFAVVGQTSALLLLDTEKEKAEITADKGIDLNAENGDCKINAKNAKIIASKEITLDSDKVTIGKNNKLTVSSSEWSGKSNATLKLEGSIVKIC